MEKLLNEGNAEKALDLLQQNPPGPGQHRHHRDLAAYCLVALHQYDQAYPMLNEAAAERGLDFQIFLALAETEANLHLPVHAERRIRRLAQVYPNQPAIREAGEFARSVREEREAQAAGMGVSPAALEEAMFLWESTYLPYRMGEWNNVIEICRRAIERCPEYEVPHLTLVDALMELGRVEEALPELQELAAHHTALGARATSLLVHLYLSMGSREDALTAAERLLELATTPETRRWEAETIAYLGDHEEMKDLLGSVRDLEPRERFLLGIANANLGDLPSARRQFQAALRDGYRDPFFFRSMEWLENGKTDLLYFPALELAPPVVTAAIRGYFRQPTPEQADTLRTVLRDQPAALPLLEQMLREDPPSALPLLGLLGTREALDRLREFAVGEEGSPADRLMAFSTLRDAGEIAEDEPVELLVEGEPRTITLGRQKITPDRIIELPSQETAALFQEGVSLLETDPEGAYDRWVELDKQFPRSSQIRIHLARLSASLGHLEESEEWLQKALELDPNSMEVHIAQAGQYLQEGNLRGAMEASRRIEEAETMTASEFFAYQGIRDGLNSIIESPLADALLAQADVAVDEETAQANREMADLLGTMQKSLALTQYLRQRPVLSLREDLTLAEVTSHMDGAVIENAAWLFGLLPMLEDLRDQAGVNEESEEDDDEDAPNPAQEQFLEAARSMLARELLNPERLAEGLPGLPDRDLQALGWLLDREGIAPLEEYLKAFPVDQASPGDMLLENGIVAEGRLAGKMTRLIPQDLRPPLRQALQKVMEEA